MNNLNKIKVGEKKHLIYDDRYFRLNAERVMKGNVIRALVELITNCDDSYSRLGKNGSKETIGTIEIRIFRKRNSCTTFKILDRAEGMTLENMYSKIGRVGYANSGFLEGKPSRGLMGRGAKECVIFGSLRYQSIKDDGYAETEINRKHLDLIAIADRPVNEADRVNLEINKGNGTLVTLEVDPKWKIPNNETFIKKFPKYYSLRDIMSEDNRKIIFIDERKPNKKYHLIYDYPDGKTVFNEEISIPEYPNANPMLIIKRSKERIKTEASSDYWEGGFQVKSEKAIHEVTSFSKDIENDLPYFEYYFGFLVCNYIDKLVRDYEKIEKKKGDHTDRNPFYIIDPERNGLNVEHPFTRALYKEAGIVVKNLLKKEREKENNKIREIENRETKNRLKKLAKEVSKFIKENVEDIEIPVDEYYIDSSEIPSGGWRIIPKGLNIPIGQEKRVYIYCKPISCKEKEYIEISTLNKDNIRLNCEKLLLYKKDNYFVNYFSIKGIKEKKHLSINLKWRDKKTNISVSVILQEKKELEELFQFEKKNYSIKEGKTKKIRVFAKWPEFINGRVKLKVFSENEKYFKILNKSVILDYDNKAIKDFRKRIASATVLIKGIKYGKSTKIFIELQDQKISTTVRVIPQKEIGANFRIEIANVDLGSQRSVLVGNLLKINGRHKIIQRYLGPEDKWNKNQNSIHFRLLIAELVADTVARMILEESSQKHREEYESLAVSSLYQKHREYMNRFLEIAHKNQIPDRDLTVG